jgi:hypothetical protein
LVGLNENPFGMSPDVFGHNEMHLGACLHFGSWPDHHEMHFVLTIVMKCISDDPRCIWGFEIPKHVLTHQNAFGDKMHLGCYHTQKREGMDGQEMENGYSDPFLLLPNRAALTVSLCQSLLTMRIL